MVESNPSFDAARAAAGSGPVAAGGPVPDAVKAPVAQPPPAGDGGGKSAPPPPPPPPPIGPDSVVALCEMITVLAVKAFCVSSGIEYRPEIERLCQLTPPEKKQLQEFAPWAMPFIIKILQNLPVIGAIAFFGTYSLMLGRRYSELKKYIPPPKKEPDEEIKTVDKKNYEVRDAK